MDIDNKKKDFKKEIIIKSREIISKMGYKKSSTEEIAKSLNRTKGALYHYFDNREEILKAVIKYEGDQLKNAIYESIHSEDDPEKKLYNFFIVRAKKVSELWNFYKSVIDEYFIRYTFIMKAVHEYNEIEESTVIKIFNEGIKKNLFKIKDPQLTSRALIKAMKGYDFFIFQGESYKKIKDELNEALRVFIRGII